MTSLCFALILALPLASAALPGEQDDLTERILARMEARMEMTEEVQRLKRRNAQVQAFLEGAERVELLRLNPRKVEGPEKPLQSFHGYEVLAHARVEGADKRKELARSLGKSFHWNEARQALCFNPRHGLKAHCQKRTLELVICFECGRIDVYEAGKGTGSITLLAKRSPIIDELLRGPGEGRQD